VFQGGWGIVHLHGVHQGPITAWLPLFLFVILFGLSMDYHVFILSRIREGHDQGLNTREAIRSGITHSGGVITSAAIVMVAVFSTFATLSVTSMKQLGVGLAVAILLDATVVRGLLLPAVMTLLGERNWYLPRWLERLRAEIPRARRAERFRVPGPSAGYAASLPPARRSSGHVLDDQHGPLVVVANLDDPQRPAGAERDRVARPPVRDRARRRRRIGGCAVHRLEPE
jgi:hypothetical protein